MRPIFVFCMVSVSIVPSAPASAQSDLGDLATATGGALGVLGAAVGLDKLLATKLNYVDVTKFDVAGVKLEMTPDQVREALRAKGFTPRATDPTQQDWTARVSEAVANRRGGTRTAGKTPNFTMASGSQGEHIEVWYAVTPTGPVAASVKYLMPTNRMTRAAFIQSIRSRYGRSTTSDPIRALYCGKADGKCVAWENPVDPRLAVELDYSNYEINLRQGSKFSSRLNADMTAAIEKAAPKDAKASF